MIHRGYCRTTVVFVSSTSIRHVLHAVWSTLSTVTPAVVEVDVGDADEPHDTPHCPSGVEVVSKASVYVALCMLQLLPFETASIFNVYNMIFVGKKI